MAKFSENRHISNLINMSCKVFCGQTSWLDQLFTILTIENLCFVHGHGQNWYFLLNFVVIF